MTITAATKWNSNAEMILDVVELGYIRPTDSVIDLTFGRGKWWTLYDHTRTGPFTAVFDNVNPDEHITLDYGTVTTHAGDYRCLPSGQLGLDWTDSFDVVVFDPPYVSMGGRATSGLPDFMDRYGLENAATTPERLHDDNVLGLREAMRITKPGGLVLAKCAPYISSGVRKEGDWWARDAAIEMGLTVHDMLIHLGDVRAQPKDGPCRACKGTGEVWFVNVATGERTSADQCMKCSGSGRIPRKVKHARNNYSVLWVFRKPKPRKGRKQKAT